MVLSAVGLLLLWLLLITGANAQTPLEIKKADKLCSIFGFTGNKTAFTYRGGERRLYA